VKAALDGLEDGEILEIRLNDGEPIQNVPRSLKNERHKVTKAEKGGDGVWLLRVVKGGLAL
jgi:TusA-related sulfurtransferase